MNKRAILTSTGTIVGRLNGFDFTLAARILPPLIEAGLTSGGELMMLNAYYGRLSEIAKTLCGEGIPFPVIHCEKDVGMLLSDAGALLATGKTEDAAARRNRAIDLFMQNCEMASYVGASAMVLHLWGGFNSDYHIAQNIEMMDDLLVRIRPYGVRLLIENVPSALTDPLTNFRLLLPYCPEVGFVFDTRFGHVHRQSETMWADGAVRPHITHIHVSDHRGERKDFATLRPILHPGEGEVDFSAFARTLDAVGYTGYLTLESPVIKEGGADAEKLRRSLETVNTLFCER